MGAIGPISLSIVDKIIIQVKTGSPLYKERITEIDTSYQDVINNSHICHCFWYACPVWYDRNCVCVSLQLYKISLAVPEHAHILSELNCTMLHAPVTLDCSCVSSVDYHVNKHCKVFFNWLPIIESPTKLAGGNLAKSAAHTRTSVASADKVTNQR